MEIGRARAIFDKIDNETETVEEKGLAIRMVLDMETHNSVTKASLLKVLDWLWNQHFELVPEVECFAQRQEDE